MVNDKGYENIETHEKYLRVDDLRKAAQKDDIFRIMTIGTFDGLHRGHIRHLQDSASIHTLLKGYPYEYQNQMGQEHYARCMEMLQSGKEVLFYVASNSDKSMDIRDKTAKESKKGRRILTYDQDERFGPLAFHSDGVYFFDDTTAVDAIANYKPHILTKGGDYDSVEATDLLERMIVETNEGKVILTPFIHGIHSNDIAERILERRLKEKNPRELARLAIETGLHKLVCALRNIIF